MCVGNQYLLFQASSSIRCIAIIGNARVLVKQYRYKEVLRRRRHFLLLAILKHDFYGFLKSSLTQIVSSVATMLLFFKLFLVLVELYVSISSFFFVILAHQHNAYEMNREARRGVLFLK